MTADVDEPVGYDGQGAPLYKHQLGEPRQLAPRSCGATEPMAIGRCGRDQGHAGDHKSTGATFEASWPNNSEPERTGAQLAIEEHIGRLEEVAQRWGNGLAGAHGRRLAQRARDKADGLETALRIITTTGARA